MTNGIVQMGRDHHQAAPAVLDQRGNVLGSFLKHREEQRQGPAHASSMAHPVSNTSEENSNPARASRQATPTVRVHRARTSAAPASDERMTSALQFGNVTCQYRTNSGGAAWLLRRRPLRL